MVKDRVTLKKKAKSRIRKRIRKKLKGTSERPRVFIFKSNKYIYSQVINDEEGVVLTAASTLEKEFREKNKSTKSIEASKTLGEILAKRLKQKKIESVIFDRGISPYHGRIKALAEAMRKAGLIF
ncbi:MAG: 50S ribosomal protein L18 [Candidatus Aminicenantes bacterium]|nr:50S ribosomal protein L18 [Candidatus Aminicenantes bacterium]